MSNIGHIPGTTFTPAAPVDTDPITSPTAAGGELRSPALAGDSELSAIASGATRGLRYGARGDGAKTLQAALKSLGFLQGNADGVYGRQTEAAVSAFQRSAGLAADGAAGRMTLAALDKALEAGGVVASEPAVDAGLAAFGAKLAEAGNAYLNEATDGHREQIKTAGFGRYYGDHSSFKSMNTNERQRWMIEHQKAGSSARAPQQSSCIGWAMENVEAAYKAAGKTERWGQIEKAVKAGGLKGTDLAKELQKDGWEAVYFNPDAKNPDDGNAEHSYTAAVTKRGKPYYGIDVSHRVTDYRPTEGKGTEKDLTGFEQLKKVPFFFGLAKGGMHTFVGQAGRVNEFHWTAMPDDDNAIEERPLTEFPWNSGVIMVPPGTWPS